MQRRHQSSKSWLLLDVKKAVSETDLQVQEFECTKLSPHYSRHAVKTISKSDPQHGFGAEQASA